MDSTTSTTTTTLAPRILRPTARRFWTLFGALVAWLALMSVTPGVIAGAMGYTGKLQLFALSNMPGYTPAQAYADLTTYGSGGRTAYAISLGLFDIVFPLLYGSVLSVGLRLVTRGFRLSSRAQRIAGVAPFIAVAANWLADICLVTLLLSYPSRMTTFVQVASLLTTIKLVVMMLGFVSLFIGGATLLARRVGAHVSGHAILVSAERN